MKTLIHQLKNQDRQGKLPGIFGRIGSSIQRGTRNVARGIADFSDDGRLNKSVSIRPNVKPAVQMANQVKDAAVAKATLNEQINQAAQVLAKQMFDQQEASKNLSRSGRTYTTFDSVNDIVSKQTEIVSATVWSTGTAGLSTVFTSSAQTQDQRRYYVDILNATPSSSTSATQFSIAYGHALGSGSQSVGQLNDSPSRAIYGQYRQLLLSPEDTRFTTEGSGSTDYIYVINFKRSLLKERLDPGNFELPLAAMTNATNITNKTGSLTASGSVITLIDDSSEASAKIGESGRVYSIVSGSINGGIHKVGGKSVYYGLAYPDYGTLILDGKMLDQQLNFRTNTGSSSEGSNSSVVWRKVFASSNATKNICFISSWIKPLDKSRFRTSCGLSVFSIFDFL